MLPLNDTSAMTERDRQLHEYLQGFLTERRKERIEEVLDRRTRFLTVVADGVYQPRNLSAVLRSCEAFGIQDVHVIERFSKLEISSGIAAGTDKWLTIRRYGGEQPVRGCLTHLRQQGYRLLVTLPEPTATPLEEISLDCPTAIVFGNEAYGISEEMQAAADEVVTIPIDGFVESFNLSVAAAICLYELSGRLRRERDDWQLGDEERTELLYDWTRRSVRHVEQLIRRWERSILQEQQWPSLTGACRQSSEKRGDGPARRR